MIVTSLNQLLLKSADHLSEITAGQEVLLKADPEHQPFSQVSHLLDHIICYDIYFLILFN